MQSDGRDPVLLRSGIESPGHTEHLRFMYAARTCDCNLKSAMQVGSIGAS